MNQHTHTHTHTYRMQRIEETQKDTFFFFKNSPLKHDLSLSVFFSFVINIFELLLCFRFLSSKFHFWIKKKENRWALCKHDSGRWLANNFKKKKKKINQHSFLFFFLSCSLVMYCLSCMSVQCLYLFSFLFKDETR